VRVGATLAGAGLILLVAAPAATAAPVKNKSVEPVASCYFDNGDGTRTVTFEVDNSNASAVSISVGANNKILPGSRDRGQPTDFAAGATRNAWAVTVTAAEFSSLKWHLNGFNVAFATSTVCAAATVPADGSNPLAPLVFGALVTLGGATALGERHRRRQDR
jgi:hypothetical protein